MDVLQGIKKAQHNCILLGDFNTASGILDSAYMESDAETMGYVSWFRSMSIWLDMLLSSEKWAWGDALIQRWWLRNDRLLPLSSPLRTQCVHLFQHPAEGSDQQLRHAHRLHSLFPRPQGLAGQLLDSQRRHGERSSACGGG